MKKLLLMGILGVLLGVSACSPLDPLTDPLYSTGNITTIGNIGATNIYADIFYGGTFSGDVLDVPHSDTHEWGEDDELDLKDLVTLAQGQRYVYSGHIWQFVLTQFAGRGGGGVPYTSLQLVTGWQAGDYDGLVCGSGEWFNHATDVYHYRLSGDYIFSENTTTENWIGWFDTTNQFPTITDNHTGFLFTNGILYATNGNGTAGTQVEIDRSIPNWSTVPLGMHYDTDAIYYYMDNNPVPVATISTNRPNDVTLYHGIWSKTTDGTVHQSWLIGYQILAGE